MSAPSASGRWKKGLRNVLSTASIAPRLCAISARAAMSQIFIKGFVGVSIQSMANSPARASNARASLVSRKADFTPQRFRTLVKSRCVPPYTLSDTTTRCPASTSESTAWVAAIPEAKQ